jgi:twitching motility protein PilT
MDIKIKQLLELALSNGASDVHISVGEWPKLRVHGVLANVTNFGEVSDEAMTEMLMTLVDEGQKKLLLEDRELDFSISTPMARFRANMYFALGRLACSLRVVPNEIPVLKDLNLPEICANIINEKQGFVIVAGPTGHGKSTTVASMLNQINETINSHIVTIEDPIEYVIKPKKSIISQREVHSDTLSFENSLRSCLRQDPNVVFVGEMRDLETISSALTVAETGHLVFSTLHTNSAAQTIDRIVDVFPEVSKSQIRTQLATVITAVISQRLLPSLDGGRVPAVEVLIANPAVRNSIREGKNFMIDNIIQTSSDLGMISLENSLATLVKTNKVKEEVAMSYALKPDELQNRLRSHKFQI